VNGDAPGQAESKRAQGGRRRGPDFARLLESSRALVGYTTADEALVYATRDIILPRADAIADAVYRHLLSHPETAIYFTLPDGRPDREQLAARAESLKAWLQTLIEAPLDERAANYAASVGRAHAQRGGRASHGVKGRYMVAAIGFVAAALPPLLEGAIADRGELVATIAAWDKLLAIHLDLFLAAYSSAAGNPHWY
jgi:hypothetical protein